jgi:hypothetical protein
LANYCIAAWYKKHHFVGHFPEGRVPANCNFRLSIGIDGDWYFNSRSGYESRKDIDVM